MVTRKVEAFGHRLRRLREEKCVAQVALADAVGISAPYLSRIETGVDAPPAEDVIRRLARALVVDADELVVRAGRVPAKVAAWLVADPSRVAQVRALMKKTPGRRKP